MQREYKVFIMQTFLKGFQFGQGVVDAKSPTEAIKKLSPFPLKTIKHIKKNETTTYRAEYDILKVVNSKGTETYYAVQRED